MIPANKKKSYTEIPESLSNQLKSTFTTESAEVVKSESQIQAESEVPNPNEKKLKTVTISEEPKKSKKADRNGQINICVPQETKTDWKVLFAKNNVNITQGIIFAVEHLKNEIEKGEVILTVGGVISKINKENQ
jgi:hypothetical protein